MTKVMDMKVNGVTENFEGQVHWRGHPFTVESKQEDSGTWGGEEDSGLAAILSGRMTTTQ